MVAVTDCCQVLVLGAGLSGLAASKRLLDAGLDVMVVEKSDRIGGLTSTRAVAGFLFDHGPHVSFTKRDEIRALFAEATQGRFYDRTANLLNNWRTRWIPHPAQCHLYGLPTELVARCLVDFVERPSVSAPKSYDQWCVSHLGRSFSEEFTFRYTRKYWTAEASELTADWVSNRVHAPTLREVIRGALDNQPADQHYITSYRYPSDGGFERYVRAVLDGQRIHCAEEAVSWNPAARTVEFSTGRKVRYERLVSSVALPDLINISVSAPADVRAAAQALSCSSVVLVNVGLGRSEGFPNADWMYFYDEDVPFARAYFPHRLSASNAPQACGSIQAEVYHSKYRPLSTSDVLGASLDAMRRCGLLESGDRVLVAETVPVRYANVIFDRARPDALKVVAAYLDSLDVVRCGRFGEWAYLWTDDAILSGWRAADAVSSGVKPVSGREGVIDHRAYGR